MIIPTTAIIVLTTTTTTINPVYGQQDKTSFNTTDSSNIQDIPLQKVHVGDIEIGDTRCLVKVTLFALSVPHRPI